MNLVPLVGQVEERLLHIGVDQVERTNWSDSHQDGMLAPLLRASSIFHLFCSQRPHLDSSLVFSTALKVLQAKGSRHLRPSFGTHYSPVSKVGLVWLIVHCRGGKIYCIRFKLKRYRSSFWQVTLAIPYNCHFFYTDTIFVRIKFTPKNADFSR